MGTLPLGLLTGGVTTTSGQARMLAEATRVLIFCLVRLEESGLVAQWESVRLTRGRSLVRYQPGPLPNRRAKSIPIVIHAHACTPILDEPAASNPTFGTVGAHPEPLHVRPGLLPPNYSQADPTRISREPM